MAHPPVQYYAEFIGHIKDPLQLAPWCPAEVKCVGIFQFESKMKVIEALNIEYASMIASGGMSVQRPDSPKIMTVEHILSMEHKIFVPMWNIRYIECKLKEMTELPRVEPEGSAVSTTSMTGEHPETIERKHS